MASRISEFRQQLRGLTGKWPALYEKLPERDWGYEEEGEEDPGPVDNISLADTKDNANSGGDSIVDPVQRLRRSIILHRIGLLRLALIAISSLVVLYLYRKRHQATLPNEILVSATDKVLVMASFTKQDIEWTKDISGWESRRYLFDDLYANLTVPRNQGREAMAYLTYIIDNYHNLPEYLGFIHGHETGWHQAVPMTLLLQAFNFSMVDEQGYVGLRCQAGRGCQNDDYLVTNYNGTNKFKKVGNLFKGFHEYVFRPSDTWYQPVPTYIKATVGAQFVVTRAAVLARPLEFWKRVRRPLTRDLSELKGWWRFDETPSSWMMGMMFEKSWPYLFGLDAQECMDEDVCWATVFQDRLLCDNKDGLFVNGKYTAPANCTLREP